jgi:hypothetical protein
VSQAPCPTTRARVISPAAVAVGLVLVCAPSSTVAQTTNPTTSSGQTLAQEVVGLRRDVDGLAAELREARAQTRAILSSLVSERQELERQVRLERIRRDTLQAMDDERKAAAEGRSTRLSAWMISASAAVAAAKTMVLATAPVHRDERLDVLSRIETRLAGSAPDVAVALERLWRFLEEEEALAREVVVDQQVLEVDGHKRFLDVARVGLSAMYARGDDGFLAIVTWDPGGKITVVPVTDPARRQTVADLFEAVGRGRREAHIILHGTSIPRAGSGGQTTDGPAAPQAMK